MSSIDNSSSSKKSDDVVVINKRKSAETASTAKKRKLPVVRAAPASSSSSSAAKSTLSVDTVCDSHCAEAIRRVVIGAFDKIGDAHSLFEPLIERFGVALVTEYIRFLALKTTLADVDSPPILSPSGPVDSVWHAHMLEPQSYVRVCRALLGVGDKVFYHSTTTAESSDRATRYERTRRLYAVYYDQDPSLSDSWPNESSTRANTSGQLFIKTMTGSTVTFKYAGKHMTTYDLKLLIQAKESVPTDQQRLIFGGRQLEDDRTLDSYSIKSESMVHLVPRLRGC